MRHAFARAVLIAVCSMVVVGAPGAAADRGAPPATDEELVRLHGQALLTADVAALEVYRPGYAFWKHVFLNPDGAVVFGSARDGRLLATFPVRGDWTREARFEDAALSSVVRAEPLERRLGDRRDQVARLLESQAGPIVHNPTRGDFLLPNARRYGGFLEEWGRIYERFGVPAELGLAQAVVESGLAGKTRSEVRAIGFCQWLPRNWDRMKKLSPHVIEAENQTTQAPYCAAYLTVLATKYGSFLPALSEHHAGIVNVGRTIINGGRLGGDAAGQRYLLGAQFARDLRILSPRTFRDLIGSYGPRSFFYTEMVFANRVTVEGLRSATPQEPIYAMRTPRALALDEVARRSGLTVAEVKRFNPALVRQVPRGAHVYLPAPVQEFGEDVSFWHRPAPLDFAAVLNEFVSLNAPPERWDDADFEVVLRDFRRRFRETGSEEGVIMSTVLAYAMQEIPAGRRILSDFRSSPRIAEMFEEGVRLRGTLD